MDFTPARYSKLETLAGDSMPEQLRQIADYLAKYPGYRLVTITIAYAMDEMPYCVAILDEEVD